ncbi:hypothetical protein Tco_0754843 [Tanacetum coccineum]
MGSRMIKLFRHSLGPPEDSMLWLLRVVKLPGNLVTCATNDGRLAVCWAMLGIKIEYNAVQKTGIRLFKMPVQNQVFQKIGNGNVVAARAKTDQLRSSTIDNCYDNEKFNMFTSRGVSILSYSEPIPEHTQNNKNDSNVILISQVWNRGGTVDQHPATVEETRAYFESLYNNLAIEVEKGVDNTAKTRRPQPRSNTKNKIPLCVKE